MYGLAIDLLVDAGYEQYEISNFARPGFRCAHNGNYWANGDYLGLGVGASSYLDGVRRTNTRDLDAYLAAARSGSAVPAEAERLVGVARAGEAAMLALRTEQGVDVRVFAERYAVDFLRNVPPGDRRDACRRAPDRDRNARSAHPSRALLGQRGLRRAFIAAEVAGVSLMRGLSTALLRAIFAVVFASAGFLLGREAFLHMLSLHIASETWQVVLTIVVPVVGAVVGVFVAPLRNRSSRSNSIRSSPRSNGSRPASSSAAQSV